MLHRESVVTPPPSGVTGSSVRLWAQTAVLWIMYTWSLMSTLAQEQLFAPTGSSVLLSAPTIDKLGFVQWTFLQGGEAKPIVDYFSDKKDLLIIPRYAAKVEFFTSNGSLLLKNVQAADSGVYKVTINLREDEARLIELIIIGPLPRPEIQGNYILAGSPAEIICEVPVGDVDSIEWKKDDGPLPPDACYQIKNHSVLYISKLDPSHCTYYTCNISNRFYWNESSYNLTFEGAPPALLTARRLSVAALVAALSCLLLLVIQFFQPKETVLTGNSWRFYTVLLQSLACVASLLLTIAAAIWMSHKGVSAALVLLCVVLLSVVLVTSMTVMILLFCPTKPIPFRSSKACCVILDSAAPGGVLLAVLFSSLLIENINKLKGEGCSDAEDHSVLTIVLCLVLLAVMGFCAGIFVWYHRRRGGPEEGGGGGAGSEVEEHQSDEGGHRSDEGEHHNDEGEHQSDEGEHRSDEGEHQSDEGEHRSDEEHDSVLPESLYEESAE
ncbi:uncharacterized protein LOC144784214 [Lissotriton helveticus]